MLAANLQTQVCYEGIRKEVVGCCRSIRNYERRLDKANQADSQSRKNKKKAWHNNRRLLDKINSSRTKLLKLFIALEGLLYSREATTADVLNFLQTCKQNFGELRSFKYPRTFARLEQEIRALPFSS